MGERQVAEGTGGPAAQRVPSERVDELARAIVAATQVGVYALKVDPDLVPTLTGTKLGGVPYWPAGQPYPTTAAGGKLMLLAQLDLADFAGDDRLPAQGLLQVFIDAQDDCSGLDFEDQTNQDGFRVVWHEAVNPTITEDDVRALGVPTSLDGERAIGNPLGGSYALRVVPQTRCITPFDHRFGRVFCSCCAALFGDGFVVEGKEWFDYLADDDCGALEECLRAPEPAHQVLGYPFFTQYDSRGEGTPFDTLLLQVDSDNFGGVERVMWGDVGVANFFINAEALRMGDFSQVLYNWDCC